jgi:hypothetical protein
VNRDFIQLKSLEGELKLSHKKSDFGITVSTKELVYQKPHLNYYIMLEDIVSIVPYETVGKPVRFVHSRHANNEIMNLSVGQNHYRIRAHGATMHSRSGLFRLGPTEFVLPIADELLRSIAQYGRLSSIDEQGGA